MKNGSKREDCRKKRLPRALSSDSAPAPNALDRKNGVFSTYGYRHKLFICPIHLCGNSFAKEWSLNRHKQLHEKNGNNGQDNDDNNNNDDDMDYLWLGWGWWMCVCKQTKTGCFLYPRRNLKKKHTTLAYGNTSVTHADLDSIQMTLCTIT